MELHQVRGVSDAWLCATGALRRRSNTQAGREAWDLAVEIREPQQEVWEIRAALDDRLHAQGLPSVETVASTIFPQHLLEVSANRDELFKRYRRLVPRLRRFPENRHGLYFDRLTAWPPLSDDPQNQVDRIIQRLISQRKSGRPKRFVYDMSVFSPINDPVPQGFPCLAYLNVKLDGRRLRMTAHYRNHYFVQRAYGNYLGLARLQAFIATEADLELGPMTCISGHAELESMNARREFIAWFDELIKRYPPECS